MVRYVLVEFPPACLTALYVSYICYCDPLLINQDIFKIHDFFAISSDFS